VPKELEGIWEGKLSLDAGMQLRMVLKVVKDKDGQLAAFFRSPDQLDRDFPIATTRLEGKNVTVEVKSVGGIFTGNLDSAKSEIVGKWKQGPANLPLTLKKAQAESKLNRPQTPEGPFPYEAVEVQFDTPGKFKLAGTLTRPKGDGRFPVAVMITGSGQQDRDETLFGHKPFLVIADHLTRRGVAVLRIDDRGVGKSGGSAAKATSTDFAEDIYSAVAYVKTRPDIDPKRIGLIGHSEGGLIGPMVAAKHPDDVAFLVLLAGPGLKGNEILNRQGELILKAMGAKPEAIATQARVMKEIARLQETEKDEATLVKKLKEIGKKERDALPPDQRKALGDSIDSSEARLTLLASPWFRFFLAYDPVPTLKQVRCPVLAVNGEKDLQVPPKEDLEAIAKALSEGGNTNFVVKELPNLNHLFQTSKSGAPSEYASIEETIAPSALQFIGDWVVQTTHAK
jgi:pimeloyl-ACP methyl ester carboxylesterase